MALENGSWLGAIIVLATADDLRHRMKIGIANRMIRAQLLLVVVGSLGLAGCGKPPSSEPNTMQTSPVAVTLHGGLLDQAI
jgi:hypothetical protein